jgi:hypothetical protein
MGEADYLSLWTLFLLFPLPGPKPLPTLRSFVAPVVGPIPQKPKRSGLTAVLPCMVKTIAVNGRSFTTVVNVKPPGGHGVLTVLLLPMNAKMKKRNPGFSNG